MTSSSSSINSSYSSLYYYFLKSNHLINNNSSITKEIQVKNDKKDSSLLNNLLQSYDPIGNDIFQKIYRKKSNSNGDSSQKQNGNDEIDHLQMNEMDDSYMDEDEVYE